MDRDRLPGDGGARGWTALADRLAERAQGGDERVTTKRSIAIALPSVGDDEWQALREPLQNGWLTQGPKVKEFETAFAARHQVAHALATTSCTTALHLALSAMRVGPGDEV